MTASMGIHSMQFSLICYCCVCLCSLTLDVSDCMISECKAVVFLVLYFALTNVLTLMNMHCLEFSLRIVFLLSIFQPYLSKSSRLTFIQQYRRSWHDKLVWTSAVYLVAAVFAVCLEQYQISTLCCITFIGSSLYHRNREIRYFNLDNIFATSLLVVFGWSLCSSYYINEAYFLCGVLGLPVAAFLLVYCGMPADVSLDATGKCCVRSNRPLYDSVHTLWHLLSGFGPILSCWYFYTVRRCQSQSSEVIVVVDDPNLMPAVAILIGLFINAAGNVAGVMPLD